MVLSLVLRQAGFTVEGKYIASPQGHLFSTITEAETYMAQVSHHFAHEGKMVLQALVLPHAITHRNMPPPPLPGQVVPLPRNNRSVPQPRWMSQLDPSGH